MSPCLLNPDLRFIATVSKTKINFIWSFVQTTVHIAFHIVPGFYFDQVDVLFKMFPSRALANHHTSCRLDLNLTQFCSTMTLMSSQALKSKYCNSNPFIFSRPSFINPFEYLEKKNQEISGEKIRKNRSARLVGVDPRMVPEGRGRHCTARSLDIKYFQVHIRSMANKTYIQFATVCTCLVAKLAMALKGPFLN